MTKEDVARQMKTVIVLGMHRSGTSMIAGVLHCLGIFMGGRLLGRSEYNPFGHFEDIRFIELNDRILAAAGGDWLHVPAADEILMQADAFQAEIQRLLATDRAGSWGWKDPRTCLTLDLFFPYIENPNFIVCHRDADEIAASLHKRDGLPLDRGLALKAVYDRRMEEFFARHPGLPRLDLDYRETLNNPQASVQEIVEFLSLETDADAYRKSLAMIAPIDKLRKRAEALRRIRPLYEKARDLARLMGWKKNHKII